MFEIKGRRFTRPMWARFAAPGVLAIAIALLLLAACGNDDADDVLDESLPTATAAVESDPSLTPLPQEDAESTDTDEDQERTEMPQPELQWDQPPAMQLQDGLDYRATLNTNKGEIVINLLEGEAPNTVNNFVFLAAEGFYTDVPFHRIINGFMIQTGDPTGTGAGGPGYRFEDEPVTRSYTPGIVAMANAGPNTNGSQFFIVHADLTGRLQPAYTIFGEVVEGMDVVNEIASVPVGPSRTGEVSSPEEEVRINSVEIHSQ